MLKSHFAMLHSSTVALMLCAGLLSLGPLGCGGATPAADSPGDTDEAQPDPGDGSEAPDAKPAGGIVRDADGDGVPDDESKSGCDSKNETQCKINMECAWSDDGQCVKAKGGM